MIYLQGIWYLRLCGICIFTSCGCHRKFCDGWIQYILSPDGQEGLLLFKPRAPCQWDGDQVYIGAIISSDIHQSLDVAAFDVQLVCGVFISCNGLISALYTVCAFTLFLCGVHHSMQSCRRILSWFHDRVFPNRAIMHTPSWNSFSLFKARKTRFHNFPSAVFIKKETSAITTWMWR